MEFVQSAPKSFTLNFMIKIMGKAERINSANAKSSAVKALRFPQLVTSKLLHEKLYHTNRPSLKII